MPKTPAPTSASLVVPPVETAPLDPWDPLTLLDDWVAPDAPLLVTDGWELVPDGREPDGPDEEDGAEPGGEAAATFVTFVQDAWAFVAASPSLYGKNEIAPVLSI